MTITELPPLISPRSMSSINTSLSLHTTSSNSSVPSSFCKKKRRRCTVENLVNILKTSSDNREYLNVDVDVENIVLLLPVVRGGVDYEIDGFTSTTTINTNHSLDSGVISLENVFFNTS